MSRATAVVTGAEHAPALSVARALHRQGVDVYGLTSSPGSPSCRSRAWQQIVPVTGRTPRDWITLLLERASHTGSRSVLIPFQDELVEAISAERSVLGQHYDFVLPDHETVQLLQDKTVFHTWADRRGFPVPRSWVVSTLDELHDLLRSVDRPLIMKPFIRTPAWQRVSPAKKAYRLGSARDLTTLPFDPFEVAPRYILQHWIEGTDSDVYFCLMYRDRAGRVLGHQVGRKVVQWPVDMGNTALCVTDGNESVQRLTSDVFDAAGLVGLGSLEVKRDREDGRWYIIEPTVGRPNLQTGVAAAKGINLGLIAYRDAIRAPWEPPTPSAHSALWLHEKTFPQALLWAMWRRRVDYRALAAAVVGARAVAFAYFSCEDFRPLVAGALKNLRVLAMPRFAQRGTRQRTTYDRAG